MAPGAGVRLVTVGASVSGASVVNDQVTGSIMLPAVSVAPLTRGGVGRDGARAAFGVSVTVRVRGVVGGGAGDRVVAGVVQREADGGLLHGLAEDAVTVVVTATPVAPGAGVRLVTVGLVVSGVSVVKDQVTGSIVLPAVSLAPLSVAV